MAALTVQIMVNVPTHDLSYDPAKAAKRHRNGDVIAVYDTAQNAVLIGQNWHWNGVISSPRSVFVHIRDLPDNLVAKAADRLAGAIKPASEVFRLSQYRLPPSALSVPVQDALRDNREITMSWAQFKSVCRKKVITAMLDPNQDEESTSIVEGDLL